MCFKCFKIIGLTADCQPFSRKVFSKNKSRASFFLIGCAAFWGACLSAGPLQGLVLREKTAHGILACRRQVHVIGLRFLLYLTLVVVLCMIEVGDIRL